MPHGDPPRFAVSASHVGITGEGEKALVVRAIESDGDIVTRDAAVTFDATSPARQARW
jgi:hypothetical protein